MSDEIELVDPVKAAWSIANDPDLSDDERLFLGAMLASLFHGRVATKTEAEEQIETVKDLWGGMSLESMRHEYAQVNKNRG